MENLSRIVGNTIANGKRGLVISQDAQVSNNSFICNSEYGLVNDNASIMLDARNNWWGDASGPTHSSNPSGKGDAVSDNVNFTPWLTAPWFPETRFGLLGDVSQNGIIRPYDASLILQFSVGSIALTFSQQDVADVSGEGQVTEYDAALILQYTVGLITSFPAESASKIVATKATPDHGSVQIGQAVFEGNSKVSLPIRLENGSEVVSSHFVLSFNGSLLSPLAVSLTPFTRDYLMAYNIRDGEVEVSLAGSLPLSGSGELAVVEFQIIGGSASNEALSLRLSDIRLNDRSFGDTAVEEVSGASHPPTAFVLHPNYPNPFNSETVIAFDLPVDGLVSIRIYNVVGQFVRKLVNGWTPAGSYRVKWDGRDDAGKPVSSGVYLCRFKAGEYRTARRLTVLR